jgi:hypothetical protein
LIKKKRMQRAYTGIQAMLHHTLTQPLQHGVQGVWLGDELQRDSIFFWPSVRLLLLVCGYTIMESPMASSQTAKSRTRGAVAKSMGLEGWVGSLKA